MVNIPCVLKDIDLRFIKLGFSGQFLKTPIEKGWLIDKNYSYDDPEITNHEGNVGIIGSETFIILDIDKLEIVNEVISELPETLEIITGSKGRHLYYKTSSGHSFVVNDGNNKRVFDIQSTGKQAVIPNSKHPNGNIYAIHKKRPIAYIDFTKLQNIVTKYGNIKDNSLRASSTASQVGVVGYRSSRNQIRKYPFTISDILRTLGINASQGDSVSDSPLHKDSTNKRCFSYNDYKDVWYDYHLQKGGTIRKLLYLLQKDNKNLTMRMTTGVQEEFTKRPLEALYSSNSSNNSLVVIDNENLTK